MYDDLISLFGDLLSELLNKPPLACKGLFRFALKDYEKTHEIESGRFYKFHDFKIIIDENIRNRLKSINLNNVEEIISRMIDELVKYQSIFTFLA